ncbi:phosphoribosyl-AMP cyclohydrolase / phosphoribosyl-ATP pyrophosphatase [Campylobacter lanienae NCTC 13004]|uniref:Histidine biosynthesis bifunctional protein HisIE n=1 Tax=Campylobacter lanienae NCTC 13004 TaxID=1031753 RepID=A0A1X9SL65_9BACT|nr:bifunctional phosphoribosyl-AMP cyclohydrolase/phosphoribosyl-ATP diphosphatase HisIE [Campylobacter lanienae]ARQ96968.1 phosphoribosyl-AMP cyclohydrolase / phosphoribosyl-ATP pyrophosphatase [Campylobacter lanienae NCTC 13004]
MSVIVNWDKIDGLLPVVVQEYSSGEVLMLAYMNQEALELTQSSNLAHYYSRTKSQIWKKGQESGNFQIVKSISLDCDNDALLLKVEQIGNAACHTGAKSCFFNHLNLEKNSDLDLNKTIKYDILDHLYHIALDRKLNPSDKSYISKLYSKSPDSYLKKMAEESCELNLAIKELQRFKLYSNLNLENFGEHKPNDPKYDIIYEAADLLFHMIIALADCDIHPNAILDELKRREGVSGIIEKNSRDK